MKPFYFLVLVVGFCMAVLMQMVTIAVPRDALVASVLSESPASWRLTLDDSLKTRLGPYDIKAEMVLALRKRASFRSEIYSRSLWAGSVLIVLSVIGVIRENKIGEMRKLIEGAAAPNVGSAGPPASVS